MRLLIVSALDIHEPDKGSSGSPQTKTIKYFLQRGDHVTFITCNLEFESNRNTKKYENLIIHRFGFPFLKKLSAFRKVGWFATSIHWFLFQTVVYLKIRSLSPREYDVFYAYEIEAVPILWLLAQIYKKPFVSRFQGTIISKDVSFLGILRRWQHSLALRVKSDLTIMTNDGTQGDKVLRNFRRNLDGVQFLVNGIDSMFLKIPAKREVLVNCPLYVYSCGRLVGWKNHDRNIRVIANVLNKNVDIILFVIGGGPDLDRLSGLAKTLGVSRYVCFTGAIEHDELVGYIGKSDIYLSNYNYSNFGKTLMEAMAGGKAIIATDVGDTASFVKDGEHGYLFDDNDIESMAETIANLAKHPNEIARLGANARDYAVKNFWSWEERFEYERNLLINLVRDKSVTLVQTS